MKVKILATTTKEPVKLMYNAARTCYSKKSPIDIFEEDRDTESMWKLVDNVLSSGHTSIMEHIYYSIAIEGVSRALLAQITRHRAGIVFSVQSQRYVEIKEDKQHLLEVLNRYEAPEMKEICDKYFIDFNGRIDSELVKALMNYRDAVDGGMKPEDARMYLPNCTKTNIVMSVNLRELCHLMELRTCKRAQQEIQDLFKEIRKQILAIEGHGYFKKYFTPSCGRYGFCPEGDRGCGLVPPLQQLKERR